MSAKNVDKHNRFRSITVGFRVSPEEQEELNRAVALSGLPKQEYCYRKCMGREVVVQPNPRVHKAVIKQIDYFIELLKRDCHLEDMNIDDIEVLEYLLRLIKGIKQEKRTQIKTEMEPRQ